MKNKGLKTMSRGILLLLMVMIVAVPLLWFYMSLPATTYAVQNLEYDSSNVLEDLISSEVIQNGQSKPFNLMDYPKNALARSPKLINVVEYCYSARKTVRSHYGLYLYIYNPQLITFDDMSVQNKVQLAVSYDEEGKPKDYEKFDLQFCNRSVMAGTEQLFYKYKVIDKKSSDGKYIVDRVKSSERRYDISGFELLTKGETTAKDYTVGGTYKYSGYAKGCGMDTNAESTLTNSVVELELLKLEVSSTYWRNPVKSQGMLGWYQNEVKSVYFSIPNRIIEKYGSLNEIHGEYYNYQTNMIMVTTNQDIYDSMTKQKGIYVTGYNSDLYSFYSSNFSSDVKITRQWAFNPNPNLNEAFKKRVYQIPLVFLDKENSIDDVVIDSAEFIEYAKTYQGVNSNEKIESKSNKYSAELFWPDLETDGYRNFRVRADATFNLLTSGWDAFLQFGLRFDKYGDVVNRYGESPIKMVAASDLVATDKDLSNNLFISPSDVQKFRKYATVEMLSGKTPVLFRYRLDYYQTSDLLYASKNGSKLAKTDAFIAYQDVSLDFDIIDLTFLKDGVSTVIPVVSNPIDIFNDITSPPKSDDWGWLLKLIISIIVLIVLAPVLPYILKFVIWVITLPFRAIGWLVKSIKKKQ